MSWDGEFCCGGGVGGGIVVGVVVLRGRSVVC